MNRKLERAMIKAGWEIDETGGGCTCWRRWFKDGGYAMITDDASHEIELGKPVNLGVYDRESNCIAYAESARLDILPDSEITLWDALDDNPIKAAMELSERGEDLLDCPADSVCGKAIIGLVNDAAHFLMRNEIDHHPTDEIIKATVMQAQIIYFG